MLGAVRAWPGARGVAAACAGAALAAGVAAIATASERAASRPTLARCVAAWNDARSPGVRRYAASVAAGGNRPGALVFLSKDGVCGLALPLRDVVATDGGQGVFVSAWGRDWVLGADPLSGMHAGLLRHEASLEGRAMFQTNATIDYRTGELAATGGRGLARINRSVIDRSPNCSRLVYTESEPGAGGVIALFDMTRRRISCFAARSFVWRLLGSPAGSGLTVARGRVVRRLDGWRCLASAGPYRTVATEIRCDRGAQEIILTITVPHALPCRHSQSCATSERGAGETRADRRAVLR